MLEMKEMYWRGEADGARRDGLGRGFIWVHVHIGCALRDGQTGVEVR